MIGEVACLNKNTGSNMLLVTGIRCRMSYRCAGKGRYLKKAGQRSRAYYVTDSPG